MKKVLQALKSRTVWMVIILFVINGVGGIREYLHPQVLLFLDALLSFLAIQFRVSQRINFKDKRE